jgi:hypothetical protein
VTRSILALVVVLAMAAAVGVVFAMFASPRGCGVYTVEAGSGAIRCVEVKRKAGATLLTVMGAVPQPIEARETAT